MEITRLYEVKANMSSEEFNESVYQMVTDLAHKLEAVKDIDDLAEAEFSLLFILYQIEQNAEWQMNFRKITTYANSVLRKLRQKEQLIHNVLESLGVSKESILKYQWTSQYNFINRHWLEKDAVMPIDVLSLLQNIFITKGANIGLNTEYCQVKNQQYWDELEILPNADNVRKAELNDYVIHGKKYHEPLPYELAPFYCYTIDGGHSIIAVNDTDYVNGEDPWGYTIPTPVKTLLNAGWTMIDGMPHCTLPYDKKRGLIFDSADSEY